MLRQKENKTGGNNIILLVTTVEKKTMVARSNRVTVITPADILTIALLRLQIRVKIQRMAVVELTHVAP